MIHALYVAGEVVEVVGIVVSVVVGWLLLVLISG